jgi:hypothetical protein
MRDTTLAVVDKLYILTPALRQSGVLICGHASSQETPVISSKSQPSTFPPELSDRSLCPLSTTNASSQVNQKSKGKRN